MDGAGGAHVAEGDLLWRPGADRLRRAHLTAFQVAAERVAGRRLAEYDDLWRWSVEDPDAFWALVWRHFGVESDAPYTAVCSDDPMPATRWFEGARLNYAEHVLRHAADEPDRAALWHATEARAAQAMSWAELDRQVRALATALRALGLQPGDTVAAYMPNVPQTVVAMLAVTAIGAVWAAAAPEFGAPTVIDRFGQIAPKLLFATDGYQFGGKRFERGEEVVRIARGLSTLEHVVWLPHLGAPAPRIAGCTAHAFEDLLAAGGDGQGFRFERVPAHHPLWVLFSSGTTGRPKAIVHSHAGIVVELLKFMHLHLDLRPGACLFFYTTTGWMIWNSVVSALMTGAASVLYDGSPVAGGHDRLWRLVEETGATCFGASPALVQMMKTAGVRPAEAFGLERLDTVVLSGAPSSAEVFAWFYSDVKPDLWVTSQSGGTEFCSGLVGGVPTRPVYAGEIQGRVLGMDVQAWDEAGRPVADEVGELIVASPCPSMPLGFWGDADGSRYRDAYFSAFPGAWRHGDLIRITPRGGAMIPGRSDATLNRYGVRIGAAEVYSVLESLDGIADSLVVCCERPGGDYYMPLFVVLAPGHAATPELTSRIVEALRSRASPRHVPDEIHVAPDVPYTLTRKKMEVPVRRLLMGAAQTDVASPDAMANPASLGWYVDFARRPEVAALWGR